MHLRHPRAGRPSVSRACTQRRTPETLEIRCGSGGVPSSSDRKPSCRKDRRDVRGCQMIAIEVSKYVLPRPRSALGVKAVAAMFARRKPSALTLLPFLASLRPLELDTRQYAAFPRPGLPRSSLTTLIRNQGNALRRVMTRLRSWRCSRPMSCGMSDPRSPLAEHARTEPALGW